MDHNGDSSRQRTRGAPRIALWAVQVLLAVAFAYFSYGKLSGAPNTVESFEAIGVGQWLRYVVGGLEMAGAIGLLVPGLAGLAALGLAGVMVGAAATEVFVMPDGNPLVPLVLLAISAFLAWVHRGRILALLPHSASRVDPAIR